MFNLQNNLRKLKYSLLKKNTETKSLLTISEITKLSKIGRYQEDQITTKRGLLKFIDACTLIEGNREIFLDEIYNFYSDSSDPTIIDCGANIGLASIYFKTIYPNSQVLAFEPDPSAYNCLVNNMKNLGLSNRFFATQAAVWIHERGVEFDIEGGFSGQIHKHGHNAVKRTVEVPSISLKRIISEYPKIDLLKIDIEGAEIDVLKDISDSLSNISNIFIEYHSHINDVQMLGDMLNILSHHSFRYHITPAYTVSTPFINRQTMLGMDLQLNVFGYRK